MLLRYQAKRDWVEQQIHEQCLMELKPSELTRSKLILPGCQKNPTDRGNPRTRNRQNQVDPDEQHIRLLLRSEGQAQRKDPLQIVDL